MSNFNLTSLASVISAAVSSEVTARNKWKKVGIESYKAGVRIAMLTKGTEKAPNPHYVADVHQTIRAYIIAGLNGSKKAEKFSAVHPDATGEEALKKEHLWTVAQLVGLTTDQLREIECPPLKATRRELMQQIDGSLMSLVKRYLDQVENPEKVRGTKEKKDAAKPAADAPLLERGKAMLNELVAALLTMKRPDGTTMDGVVQAHEAACEALARLGQVK